ncbi:MAG TPA: acetate--CoA ligase family protein [Acidimicrobiales bacterium]|nr:acetate--CoA ligase family protein [Acidimicrobiales bacterium]
MTQRKARPTTSATPAGARLDVSGRPVALRHLDLATFFKPKTVCVVGASDANTKPNTPLTKRIIEWSEARGATIHLVNPNRPVVAGRKTVASMTEIDEPIDLVTILVGNPLPIVQQAIDVGAKYAVVFAAGFSEVGREGERLQAELERMVAESGLHVLGPNTNLNAFEEFRDDLPGRPIALVTQSGHQGRPIYQGQEIGIRLSHWAPVGNEADLEVADFVNYFAMLPDTGAIACYVEGFKDGRTLQLALDQAARHKVPVVVVKVGRTAEGRNMAKAHTGHLTGADAVVSAVFRQYGVTRVDGLDELLDVSATFARTQRPSDVTMQRLRRGLPGRVCVYSISGGTGAHMADLLASGGLQLPELTKKTQSELRKYIAPWLRVSNPVDNGAVPVRDWRGAKMLEAIVADPNIDMILCPITGALASMTGTLTRDLVDAAASTHKPVLVVWGSPVGDDPAYRETLLGSGVPTFRTFHNAVAAAASYFAYHRFADGYRSELARPRLRPSREASAARAIIGSRPRYRQAGSSLSEHDSKALLSSYGIAVPEELVATRSTEAVRAAQRIGYPVVMKIASPDIAHKSDLGLVEVRVRNDAEVRATYRRLLDRAEEQAPEADIDGVLVAERLEGVETVLGIAHDDLFGPVVMVGMGGVFVEVLHDVSFRVPPFGRRDAAAMLDELAGVALLTGVRGGARASRHALVDTILAVQKLALDLSGEIAELDINPLLAGPSRAVAADALVVTR